MKKSLLAICLAAGLMLAPAGTAMADEQVSVTLPAFPVTLNGVTFEQSQLEYPLLVYKNITYVAMTYHDARLLGLETQWTMEQGLFIKKWRLCRNRWMRRMRMCRMLRIPSMPEAIRRCGRRLPLR